MVDVHPTPVGFVLRCRSGSLHQVNRSSDRFRLLLLCEEDAREASRGLNELLSCGPHEVIPVYEPAQRPRSNHEC